MVFLTVLLDLRNIHYFRCTMMLPSFHNSPDFDFQGIRPSIWELIEYLDPSREVDVISSMSCWIWTVIGETGGVVNVEFRLTFVTQSWISIKSCRISARISSRSTFC